MDARCWLFINTLQSWKSGLEQHHLSPPVQRKASLDPHSRQKGALRKRALQPDGGSAPTSSMITGKWSYLSAREGLSSSGRWDNASVYLTSQDRGKKWDTPPRTPRHTTGMRCRRPGPIFTVSGTASPLNGRQCPSPAQVPVSRLLHLCCAVFILRQGSLLLVEWIVIQLGIMDRKRSSRTDPLKPKPLHKNV